MKRRTLLKSAAACLAVTSLPAIASTRGKPVSGPDINTRAIDAFADAARQVYRLHSLVVMQQGEIVLAESFRGLPVDRAVNVKSVSKSVVAALVGCALERGSLAGVDVTLGERAPELLPTDADPRVARLRVQDFLTMRIALVERCLWLWLVPTTYGGLCCRLCTRLRRTSHPCDSSSGCGGGHDIRHVTPSAQWWLHGDAAYAGGELLIVNAGQG